MPHVVTPRELAIIFLASMGHEVSSLLLPAIPQLSQQLSTECKIRMVNLGIQYGAAAATQVMAQGKFVDVLGPYQLLEKGVISMATASTVEEAVTRGTIAAAVLVMSGLATNDPNTSLTFGGFLIVLAQNVLSPGSHAFLPPVLIQIYIAKNILIRIITEIRVEKKRRELKLPRAKFKFSLVKKFSLFKKQKKEDFVFKYPRFKKRKINLLSRNILVPVLYKKKLIIKHPKMVELITID